MLFETEFYESGKTIADRIVELAGQVSHAELSQLAIEARSRYHLRHVPLMLLCALAKRGGTGVASTIESTIQRADELSEFVALYWKVNKDGKKAKNGKAPLSKQVRKGLAAAFCKFSAYNLAKYDRDADVRLRDVLFLTHAKPKDETQAAVWKQLVDRTLPSPDTWEVALSAGKNKRETWETMLKDGTLGYLALLRNLRNMEQAGVDQNLMRDAIRARKGAERVLPFRYVAAARACPRMEDVLDEALVASVSQLPKFPGKTIFVVDISGSMRSALSGKSDMTRQTAACALAAIGREMCEDVRVYATAGDDMRRQHATGLVPPRRGMAMIDAIEGMKSSLGGGGIFLTPVMEYIKSKEGTADRIIVITDEQDCALAGANAPSNANPFGKHNYLINVASAKNGIGYGPKWNHLDGFSESVLRWMHEFEQYGN
jgi:hypothetical protein